MLKELISSCPAEYVYIGDSLRAPYGNKSKEELISHTKELIVFLKSKGCDFFVNACNSLSSLDVEPLLEEMGIKKEDYMDMISATRNHVGSDLNDDAKILIYATAATIRSGAYQDVFENYDVETLVSKNLAFAIESGNQIEIDEEVDELVDTAVANNITHLFLGCTHFPIIMEYLEKRLEGLSVKIINPAKYVPRCLISQKGDSISVQVYTTKKSEMWKDAMTEFEGVILSESSLISS